MNDKLYNQVKQKYAKYGVDTDKALDELKKVPVSINCWQGDDFHGFETEESSLSGGILVTGDHPGIPSNIEEFRQDTEKAFSMIPGQKKLALEAMYGDYKGKLKERNEIKNEHFASWVDWAQQNGVGIDINPTLFSHPKASGGYTLASKDKDIRNYWIEHVKLCREICNYIGSELNQVCFDNLWVPDGSKDINVTKLDHREVLIQAFDEIFEKKYPKENMDDALESKLFGIGVESYTVGSLELYISYAVQKGLQVTLDTGHFHPTEKVSDKISALLPFFEGLQLHVTRGVRWDSDHVPIIEDELVAIMQEIVRANALDKVFIGTDFFDASISRIGAWAIGTRTIQKSLMLALLEPTTTLKDYEREGNNFARLASLENLKFMPFEAVWDHYCEIQGVPKDDQLIDEVMEYERNVILKR